MLLGEDGANALTARDFVLYLRVSYPAETREHLKFKELSVIQTQCFCRFPQGRRLGLAANTADTCSYIDRRLLVRIE